MTSDASILMSQDADLRTVAFEPKNALSSSLQTLFHKEREMLDHFFDQIDLRAVEQLLALLQACKGIVIVTGIGKSGLVAEKIALTLTSTGTRAFYLSASNALHGDIGIVQSEDIFLMISKGGESEELLQLIPFLRNRNVKVAAIVNQPNSRLAKSADLSIVLPLKKELCFYDLVPTTSTVTQMIFGNILAVALMLDKIEHNKFSLAEYALNHPGGKIGRRLTLKVKDLMLKDQDLPLCAPQDKLLETLVTLSNKRCGCVMIVDAQGKLQGIFTDGDLRRALQKYGPQALECRMQELMTSTPRAIAPSEKAINALQLMESDQKRPITVLPVVSDEQKVEGLIKMHDILQSGL